MLKRITITLFAGTLILVGSYFVADYFFSRNYPDTVVDILSQASYSMPRTYAHRVSSTTETIVPEVPTPTGVLSTDLPKKVLLEVPFTPQAPFGDWTDPRQQDGCEEASVVMAWKWVNGEELTRQQALEEITQMAEWEKDKYGSARDTSAEDTLHRLLREYYGYKGGRVEYGITIDKVKTELAAGNILIIPFDGQVLNNPNFQNGGPERHMLVVIGYDDVKKQIITNDPGTRLGQGFVYSYDNFEASFRDYETGDHELIQGRRTAMIVVEKSV